MKLFIAVFMINCALFCSNGQIVSPGLKPNPCEQLAQCLTKFDSAASLPDCIIIPLDISAAVASDEALASSAEKGSAENSKLPGAIGTCLDDMRSVLDELKLKMSERLQFFSKCLVEQAANQTTDTLFGDVVHDPKQPEKCRLMSADVTLANYQNPAEVKEQKEQSKKNKKKRQPEDEQPKKQQLSKEIPPAANQCAAQKRYLAKQCQKVSKCCPVYENCRLQFELSDTHTQLTRAKLGAITQRQKCVLLAKKVNLESAKLDQLLDEDIFNEHGMFI